VPPSVLGLFSPRPVAAGAAAPAPISPELLLQVARTEREGLRALLQAQAEAQRALTELHAECSARSAAEDALEAAEEARSAAERERAAALAELRNERAALQRSAVECAGLRAALLSREVEAEDALFGAAEAGAARAAGSALRAQAARLRDAMREALLRLGGAAAPVSAEPLEEAMAILRHIEALARPPPPAALPAPPAAEPTEPAEPAAPPAAAAEAAAGIRVIARVRPPRAGGEAWAATEGGRVLLGPPGSPAKSFALDEALGPEADQEELYSRVAPLVTAALSGQAACILAYGQSGSGKTHSMAGAPDGRAPGVMPRALAALFAGGAVALRLTMLEVYNETVRDLLHPSGGGAASLLSLRHAGGGGGARAAGATALRCADAAAARAALARGAAARKQAPTAGHACSSRSHLLVGLQPETAGGCAHSGEGGSLWLVDLAGSEGFAAAGGAPPPLAASASLPSMGGGEAAARAREAACINKSLSALFDCVEALARKQVHVPWRNSKLTALLAECLLPVAGGGEGPRALLLAHVSPARSDSSESAATLGFAERARAAALARPPPRLGAAASAAVAAEAAKAEAWRGRALQAAAERDAARAEAARAAEEASRAAVRATLAEAAAAGARREAAPPPRSEALLAEAARVQAILSSPMGARARPRTPAPADENAATPAPPPRSALKARRPLGEAGNGWAEAAHTPHKQPLAAEASGRLAAAGRTPGRAAGTPSRQSMLGGAERVTMRRASSAAQSVEKAARWTTR